MKKLNLCKSTSTVAFRCDPEERLAMAMVVTQTGLSMSEVIRQCLRAGIATQLAQVRAVAAECPPGQDPELWLSTQVGKLMAVAQAARLRAEADALDPR